MASQKVSIVVKVALSSDSICSLSDIFDFKISRSASSNRFGRDVWCTQNTSLYACMRTFFSCSAHSSCVTDVWLKGQTILCVCAKSFHLCVMSLLGVPSRSFHPIFSSPTCSLTRPSASFYTTDWNQKTSPCHSAMGCNVWPYGQSNRRHRKWIDVEPGTFDQNCLEVSKLMMRLLRHDDSVIREEDGAVKIEALASIFLSRITSFFALVHSNMA